VLSDISFMADDHAVAETEAKKAIELNPNFAEAYEMLGAIEAQKGNMGAMVSNAETSYQLNPLSPFAIAALGRAYFYAGREQDALDHWKRTLHLDPVNSYRWMADYYFSKGDLEKAEATVKELEKVAPTSEFALLNRGYLAALKGDRATALEIIEKLDVTRRPGYIWSNSAGFIYLALGDTDKFFEYMNIAAKGHYLPANNLRYSPLFAEVRKDPRFRQLLESVGIRMPSN
jgi:tetratricopeptide (TPR) repeat protein